MASLKVDDKFIKIWFEEGFICGVYKVQTIDEEVANHAINTRLKVSEGNDYPLLVWAHHIRDTTKKARDILASERGCEGLKAMAIIINSPVGKVIANFYLRISGPRIPTQIFTNETKARKWLQQFVESEVHEG